MTPCVCPVCQGRKKVAGDFYKDVDPHSVTDDPQYCQTCMGNGMGLIYLTPAREGG